MASPTAMQPPQGLGPTDDCSGLCIMCKLHAIYTPPHLTQQSEPSYPPVSSIPRTPATRFAQPDARPTPLPTEPVLATPIDPSAPARPATLLYLAYGSNLCAETFLGRRGIRPLSATNVSAPSLRLVFDLPGLPYREPCMANTAMRRIPGTPPKLPPGMPDLPKPPPGVPDLPHDPPPSFPPFHAGGGTLERNSTGDPVWNSGLIGVVYEVTAADYAKILATEGGGSSYHEILVPCLALPPTVGVPEKPPVPELPRPFVARTLYAPRLPDVPDGGGDNDHSQHPAGDDDDDDDDPPSPPPPPSWMRKLLLPVRRPDPDYAQPSARYLKLIRDGAREHDLPGEYQEYLAALRHYQTTTWRQRVGQVLFLLFWAPWFVLFFTSSRLLADDKGRVPAWLGSAMTVLFNLVWLSYDAIAKPLFGEGERTIASEEGGQQVRGRRNSVWRRREEASDEEKRALIGA